MNALNKPEFLQNNKTFQTIYGRNLLHELNIIYKIVSKELAENDKEQTSKRVQNKSLLSIILEN